MSIPCGFVNGLPVGLHFMSDHLREDNLIKLGYVYEKRRGEIKYPEI
jgi:aspartyl-tRNA(Asn)/glutamyl-tRNA(Gln) amidotransferase subunit A